MADLPTTNYQAQLTHFLAPLPRLSSSIANSTPIPASSATSCLNCHAELIGGVNSSYRLFKGERWARCEGCGSVQAVKDGSGSTGRGKDKFSSVRKSQRMKKSLPYPLPPSVSLVPAPVIEARKPPARVTTSTTQQAPIVAPSLPVATSPEAAKKSRRAKKQPSGLTMLLEAKRKEKEGLNKGTKLEDFLAGI